MFYNSPLCNCSTTCLSILLLMDIWIIWSIRNKATICILDQIFFCGYIHLFLLRIHVWIELLDHRVDKCLTWLKTDKHLSKMGFTIFHSHHHCMWHSVAPHSYWHCQSSNSSHRGGMKLRLTVLIFIFLIVLVYEAAITRIQ